MFFTKAQFWLETIERAVKTAAQFAVFYLIGTAAGVPTPVNFFTQEFNPQNMFGFAISGALLSVLTSLTSGGFAPAGTPSLVRSYTAQMAPV